MDTDAIPAILALVVQLGLGLAVLQANPKRRANQCFLLLSLASGAWLTSLGIGVRTQDARIGEFCIRQASFAGALYLAALNLLRLSIRQGHHGWRTLIRLSRPWFVGTFIIGVLC